MVRWGGDGPSTFRDRARRELDCRGNRAGSALLRLQEPLKERQRHAATDPCSHPDPCSDRVFPADYWYLSPPLPTQVSLGYLGADKTIVIDVQGIAATGDCAASETRIGEFEGMWHQAEYTMRPLNPGARRQVDDAADAVLSALRRGTPNPAQETGTLTALQVVLDDLTAGLSDASGPIVVTGIRISDESGHPPYCEYAGHVARCAGHDHGHRRRPAIGAGFPEQVV